MKSLKDFSLLFGLLVMSMLLVQCGTSKKNSDADPPKGKRLKAKKVQVRQVSQPEGAYKLTGVIEVKEDLTDPLNIALVSTITEITITNTQNSGQIVISSGDPLMEIEIQGEHNLYYTIAEGLGAIPSNILQENGTVDITISYLGGTPEPSVSEDVEYLFEYD